MAILHPLEGVRVIEMGNFMAGPFCGMLLADMGAVVLKVENPQGGDFSRASAPFVQGESAGFVTLNRNKQSVAMNVKHSRGRELFLELVRDSDVLVENMRPGTMEELGFGYPALATINPRLIYSSASGYGQTGPYRQRAALDLIIQGMSGLMSITGEEGRPPVKVGVPIADLSAGLFGAYAIIAALYAREKTGRGQQIDVSLLECALALQVWETSGYFATGQVPRPLGSAHRVSAPYQAIRTSDGYITIGATTPGNWKAACALLGLDHLEQDDRFAVVSARRAHFQELAEVIESVTALKPSAHWYARFEEAGIPCGVLNRLDEALQDPQVQARGFVVELRHTSIGSVRATGSPVRLSETPLRLDHAGPLLGEHTREVLLAHGVSETEMLQLVADDVITVAQTSSR